jgi:serine/threonine protein kinase/formylglycine-generating enzyme required for sulfatase activity
MLRLSVPDRTKDQASAPMTTPHGDRNLVFGILALQLDFINRDQLVDALQAWLLDKSQPLGRILVEKGALSRSRHDVLQALVEEHLAAHEGDPEKSLTILGFSTSPVEGQMEMNAGEVLATLTGLAVSRTGTERTRESLPGINGSASDEARFHVVRPLAKGGLGEVFVAEDAQLHREVALKTLQARFANDPESRDRFLLEAEITGRLEHPGIVPVYGLTMGSDGRPFYAMRLIKGETLLDALKRYHQAEGTDRDAGERTLELRGLLTRFVAVCNAVAYAHSRGVLHRDLKPANVLLGPYGETLVVDWGLAKTLGSTAEEKISSETTLHPVAAGDSGPTELGQMMGTPAYVSPEQAAGLHHQLSPSSDVYSLGATLYHLLTGQAPFGGGASKEILNRVLAGAFVPPRQVKRTVPEELEAVCLKAMAMRPPDRYASARHLAADLEHWLADEPVSAYREGPRSRLGRWVRHHTTLATTVAALLLLGGITVVFGLLLANKTLRDEQAAARNRVKDRIDAFCNTSPQMVPLALKTLDLDQPELVERLHELWERPGAETVRSQRMRVGMALLAREPDKVRDELVAWMLEAEDPAETLLVRDVLLEHRVDPGPKPAELAAGATAENSQRMRALVALAAFDPNNPKWSRTWAEQSVRLLAATDLRHQGSWMEGLRPVHNHLLNPLERFFTANPGADFTAAAAALQVDLARNNPKLLPILLAEATPTQFNRLRPVLMGHPESKTLERLIREALDRAVPPEDAPEPERERLARRRLNLAAALLRLAKPEAVWPLFRSSADPLPRTYLIHRLAALNVDPKILLDRLEKETDAQIRQGLILSLDQFSPESFPADFKTQWQPRFEKWYRDDSDPGVHSAIDWLMRYDQEGRQPRKFPWRMTEKLAEIDKELAGLPPGERRWLVDKHGYVFALFPGPVRVRKGSPANEPGRGPNDEEPHELLIPRSFAAATKMVTKRQYEQFLDANPEVRKARANLPTRNYENWGPETPARGLTWYDAALYCRWLDDLDGLDEDQKCFPPIEVIELCRRDKKEVPLPKNYLQRTGHRLPTDAEYEYFCRAGALTSRFYGPGEEMLPFYGWFTGNARARSWPVGQKKPNDFGMFDALGNGWQWLLGFEGQRTFWKTQPVEDRECFAEDFPPLSHGVRHILAAGCCIFPPRSLRCASRVYQAIDFFDPETGLRVVRTLK